MPQKLAVQLDEGASNWPNDVVVFLCHNDMEKQYYNISQFKLWKF